MVPLCSSLLFLLAFCPDSHLQGHLWPLKTLPQGQRSFSHKRHSQPQRLNATLIRKQKRAEGTGNNCVPYISRRESWISSLPDLALTVPAMSPWESQWTKNTYLQECRRVYHCKVSCLRCLAWHLATHVHAQGPCPASFLLKHAGSPPILSSLRCLLSPFMMSVREWNKNYRYIHVVCWVLCQELSVKTIWGICHSHSAAATVMPILEMRKLKPSQPDTVACPGPYTQLVELGFSCLLCCYLLSSSTMHWGSYTMCVRMTAWLLIRWSASSPGMASSLPLPTAWWSGWPASS